MPDLKHLPGSDILFRSWLAPQTKAVILLVHGLGAHSGRWNFLADFMTRNNFSCYAIELKGFGETPNKPRGHIDSFQIYYNDIKKLYEFIKKENPDKKVFILGESLGGLISFNVAAQEPALFNGGIFISPAFKNGMKFSLADYWAFIISLLFNQKKALKMPFTSEMCTRDKTYQQQMNADKRELRVSSSRLLLNTLGAQTRAKKLIKQTNLPILFLLSGKDYLVDEHEAGQVFAALGSKDKTKLEYPEMLHALSIDLGREKVFADILSWLEQRL